MASLPLLLAFAAALAAPGQHHEHGQAELVLSTEGRTLIAAFTVDADTAGAAAASPDRPLEEPGALFVLDSRPSCRRQSISLTETAKADHEGEEEGHHGHTDIRIEARFVCRSELEIRSVTVTAFEALGELEGAAVTVLTSRQQAEEKVNRRRPEARF
jgi:hypothetical protein